MNAIYCRISLDRTGEALGVERQEKECRELAARLGLEVHEVFVDNDLSATSGVTRPEFDRMLAAKPDAIIAWHQDRLLRLTVDLERVIALNVPVYTVTAGTLDLSTPAGRAVARTVAAWSQYEGEQKALRQKAANDQRAAAGIPHGQVGYGYRRSGAGVVVEPSEAGVIREAARRLVDGDSLRSVCADFQSRGIPTPGRGERWNTTTLKQLVLRPSLAGLRQHRGQIVGRTAYEPIIDEDMHHRLVALLTDPSRRTSKGGRAPRHLLSGLARCGRDGCDGVMHRNAGWTPKPDSKSQKRVAPAYVCTTCHRVRRLQAPLDAFIEELTIGRLEQADVADLFLRGDADSARDARDAIAAIDARLATAADAYAEGQIDLGQLTRITARLRADRDEHEAALSAAMPPAIPVDAVGPRAREVWQTLDLDRKRGVIDALMTIRVLPGGVGKRGFDPSLIVTDWRR